MPDICMCTDEECSKKDTCYRFKAIPGMVQAYSDEMRDKENDTCDHYWDERE